MTRTIRVLVADDERNLRELLVRELGRKGLDVEGVADGEAALERLAEGGYDVVVLDMKMPRREGIEVLRELAGMPEAPQVIVMTGFQEVGTAVEAMKLGAYDYLTKPAKIEELDILIRKAAEKGRLIRQNVVLRAQLDPDPSHAGILTANPKMEDVLRVVDRVAPTDYSVLILGESGTGKELVARAVHEHPLIQGLILTACSVAVAFKGLGPVGLAGAYLMGPLTAALMSLWLVQRKFFYVFTCEYCFSHYVTIGFLAITGFHLLLDGWRGLILAWFAVVWIANLYMSIFGRLRLDIKSQRIEIAKDEAEVQNTGGI